MSWSASGIFVRTIEDILEQTTAIDMNDASGTYFKVALYNDSITPDKTVASASTAYNAGQWANTNEVSDSTNWDSGGEPLTGTTFVGASNVITFDGTDTPQGGATCTLADVYGCLVYADGVATPVADQGISFHWFGGVQSVTDGTFTVVWNGSGIYALTL